MALEDVTNVCNNEVHDTSEYTDSYTDQENEEPARKRKKMKQTGKYKFK